MAVRCLLQGRNVNYVQTLQLQLQLAQLQQQQQAQLSQQQQLARQQQQHFAANGVSAGLERFFNAATPAPGMPAQVPAAVLASAVAALARHDADKHASPGRPAAAHSGGPGAAV